MWPFTLSKSVKNRIETLEERSEAVERMLNSFNTVYRDVFDGSVFRKIEADLNGHAERFYEIHRKDVSERMSDVRAKITDVEEYMKSLGSNLDAIRGLDRDIESLSAENKRMAAENERIEALIEKCRKEIDHYRFEDSGFGEFLDKAQNEAAFYHGPPALEDPESSICALAGAPSASSTRPDNLLSDLDFDVLLPTRSYDASHMAQPEIKERAERQSAPPPLSTFPSGPAYRPATDGLADSSPVVREMQTDSMRRAISSLSSSAFDAPTTELPPPRVRSRTRPDAFSEFVDMPNQTPSITNPPSVAPTQIGADTPSIGADVVSSLGAPVSVTGQGSS
jgi:hypothetical protein